MAPAERGRKGVPRAGERVIANNALVGGPAACALLGYTVLLGVEVVLLVILALAHLPVRRECLRSLPRSVPTPSVQMDAMARALGDASPEYLTFQPSLGRRSADGGVVSKLAGQLHSAAAPALSRSDGPRP